MQLNNNKQSDLKNGQKTQIHIFPRKTHRHTNVQQIYEKILNINNIAVNEMQIKNEMRYCLIPVRMAIIIKTRNKFWRRCGEKGVLLHCSWQCKLVQPLWKTGQKFFKVFRTMLPAILENLKTLIHEGIHTPMFTEA